MSYSAGASFDGSAFQGQLRGAPQYIQRPVVSRPASSRVVDDVLPDTYQDDMLDDLMLSRADYDYEEAEMTQARANAPRTATPHNAESATQSAHQNRSSASDLEPVGLPDPTIKQQAEEFLHVLSKEAKELTKDLAAIRMHHRISLRTALFSMAFVIFLIGAAVSMQTLQANKATAAQIQALYEQTQ